MIHPLAILTYPTINPVIFKLGPIAVRWYGVSYLTGFVLAYLVLVRLIRWGSLRIPDDWLSDLVGWLALGVVAGGRTGWWLFYHVVTPDSPPEHWYTPFAIWQGGMSFHGGLTGVILVLCIWSYVYKLSFFRFLNIADCLALVTPIGLCLGRIANFINAELYGRVTSLPWAMRFPLPNNQWTEPRHPSQLYESFLEGPLLLAVVWWMRSWKKRRDGQIAAGFVIFYMIFRFFVEFTREPDKELGYMIKGQFLIFYGITRGQELSIAGGIVGLICWLLLLKQKRTALENQQLEFQSGFPVIPTGSAKEPKAKSPKEKSQKN